MDAVLLSAKWLSQGFDEYMNLVLDEAEEVSLKRQTRKPVGEDELVHIPHARLSWGVL